MEFIQWPRQTAPACTGALMFAGVPGEPLVAALAALGAGGSPG